MPEPENITADDRARWDKALANCPHPEARMICSAPDTRARLWYPGQYLAEQLEAMGCSPELSDRIGFAAGQRMFAAADTWAVVFQTLSDYNKGKYDEPGSALAEQLFQDAVASGDIILEKDTLTIPNENLRVTRVTQEKSDGPN